MSLDDSSKLFEKRNNILFENIPEVYKIPTDSNGNINPNLVSNNWTTPDGLAVLINWDDPKAMIEKKRSYCAGFLELLNKWEQMYLKVGMLLSPFDSIGVIVDLLESSPLSGKLIRKTDRVYTIPVNQNRSNATCEIILGYSDQKLSQLDILLMPIDILTDGKTFYQSVSALEGLEFNGRVVIIPQAIRPTSTAFDLMHKEGYFLTDVVLPNITIHSGFCSSGLYTELDFYQRILLSLYERRSQIVVANRYADDAVVKELITKSVEEIKKIYRETGPQTDPVRNEATMLHLYHVMCSIEEARLSLNRVDVGAFVAKKLMRRMAYFCERLVLTI